MELEESGIVRKEFAKSIFHHFRLIIPNGKLRVLLVRRAMQTNFTRQTTILIKECVHQPPRLYPQQIEPHPLKRGNLTTRVNSSSPCNQWPTATNTGHTHLYLALSRDIHTLCSEFGILPMERYSFNEFRFWCQQIWSTDDGSLLCSRTEIHKFTNFLLEVARQKLTPKLPVCYIKLNILYTNLLYSILNGKYIITLFVFTNFEPRKGTFLKWNVIYAKYRSFVYIIIVCI